MSQDMTYCVWRYKDCAIAPSCARAVTPTEGHHHSFIAPETRCAECKDYVKKAGQGEARRGMAGQGEARRGKARLGWQLYG